jgi:hypothetical protein
MPRLYFATPLNLRGCDPMSWTFTQSASTTMANKDLRKLRLEYKAAFTTYMRSVQALSEASQNGELPTTEVIDSERVAFNDLRRTREALLRALKEHTDSAS